MPVAYSRWVINMVNSNIVDNKSYQTWFIGLVSALGILIIFAVAKMAGVSTGGEKIANGVQYYHDLTSAFSHQQVLSLAKTEWQTETSHNLAFGLSSSPYWLRFELPPTEGANSHLLEVDYPMLDILDMWFFADKDLIQHYQTGDTYPFSQRPVEHDKFIFPVPQVNSKLTVLVRLQSHGSLKFPLRYWLAKDYWHSQNTHNLMMGLFFGFMLAMVALNLLFSLATFRVSFFYYAGYAASAALSIATLHGICYRYFWPHSPWIQNHAVPIFVNLSVFFAILFFSRILRIEQHDKTLQRSYRIGYILMGVSVFSALFLPIAISTHIILLVLPAFALFYLLTCLWLWLKGVHIAGLNTLASSVLIIAAIITSLENYDLLHLQIPSIYLLILGLSIEAFLLSLVLALDYSQQSKDLIEAQKHSLEQERHARLAQEQTIEIQQEAQQSLEYNVQERTLELEIALRELSETNRELEETTTIDSLTGIRNRRYFDKKYIAEMRRSWREHTCLSIVMLDIDHFKRVNDLHGHLAGDACIQAVAKNIQSFIKRSSDVLCRYGGEEFALILPNTDESGASALAESVRSHIEQNKVKFEDIEIKLTISAGVCSQMVGSMDDQNKHLSLADQALYAAKNSGRNRVYRASQLQSEINQQEAQGE